MPQKVKLKETVIVKGLPYMRETLIDRKIVAGTRFDSEEFLTFPDDPDFKEPPWNDMERLDVNMQEREPPPEESVKVRHVLKRRTLKKG